MMRVLWMASAIALVVGTHATAGSDRQESKRSFFQVSGQSRTAVHAGMFALPPQIKEEKKAAKEDFRGVYSTEEVTIVGDDE